MHDPPAMDRRTLLLRAATAAVEATDVQELADATLAPLQAALDAAWISLCVCESANRYLFLSSHHDVDKLAGEYAEVATEDPMHEAKVEVNPDVAVLTDMVERSALQRSAVASMMERYDARELLFIRATAVPCGQVGAVAYVAGGHKRGVFDNELLDEIRVVRPLFQATLERNERTNIASAIARSSSGGVLALRADGQLAWMCEAANRLLGGAVPREVRDAAVRVASLGASTDAAAPLIVPLQASLLEAHVFASRAASNGSAVIVVRVFPMRCATWVTRLPPRLRRVLELLETGASEKEIADLAGLSYASTHQYVVQIYRRAGVSSRAQLMARLAAARD